MRSGNFNRFTYVAATALVMFASAGGAALAADESRSQTATADKLKAAVTPGEVVLSGSDVKSINDSDTAKRYRVCVKKEEGNTDLKVTHDDAETRIKPGECKSVTGKKIDATPASSLSGSDHIVMTYHRVKPKSG